MMAVALGLSIAPCTAGPSGPSSGGASETTVPAYATAWEASRSDISLSGLHSLVAQLQAAEPGVRESAYTQIVESTGLAAPTSLSKPFNADAIAAERQKAVQEWEQYLLRLQDAVDTRIARILRRPASWSPQRDHDVMFLGEVGHSAFLPLLRSVAENGAEATSTRIAAFFAITNIPHENMIPYAISHLEDSEGIAINVLHRLNQITGSGIQVSTTDDPDWRRSARQAYEHWWQKHQATYRFDRMKALGLPGS